jgi:hypothetical protein
MKAKEFYIKKRDPNWRAMQDIRRSGAGGQHKDKKKAAKQGQVKHKGQMAEGSEQVYKVIAVDKNNALGKKVKLNVKADSVDEVFERLAMSDWYPLSVNGVEVIDGKRLAQGVSEGDEPDEQYLDKVISDLHKDALGFRPDQEFGREWMSSSFEEKLEIYNNLLKSLHGDMDEGIGGTIAGGVGQFIGNKIDPLAGEIMRAHGEIAGRKAEYTIRKYMHLLQKALKQQLDSGGSSNESMQEVSDFGEPREILENVLQTLEREVEWPLTDVMDPREVRQLLAPIVKAVNDKMMSMEEGWNDQDDWSSMSHREFKRRELEHELGHEDEMANYAVLINNKKWKVFDNKRAAEKAAVTIQQKYGKDTRVVQTMERPS